MKQLNGVSLNYPESFTWDKNNNKIIERKGISPFDDNGQIWYSYKEYRYSVEEYIEYKLNQIGANIDYISMMTEVDL